MESLSAADVLVFLKKSCPDVDCQTFDIIKNEKLSGKRALKLDLQGWKSIGVSFGEAVDITGAIESLQNGDIQFFKDADNCSNHENALSSTSTSDINPNKGTGNGSGKTSNIFGNKANASSCNSLSDIPQAKSSENISHSNNNNEDIASSCINLNVMNTESDKEDTAHDFSGIEEYFTAAVFSEMGQYEKTAFVNQKEMYEEGLSKGLLVPKPLFMKKKPVIKPRKNSTDTTSVSTFSMRTRNNSSKGQQQTGPSNSLCQDAPGPSNVLSCVVSGSPKSSPSLVVQSDASLSAHDSTALDQSPSAGSSRKKKSHRRKRQPVVFSHFSSGDESEVAAKDTSIDSSEPQKKKITLKVTI